MSPKHLQSQMHFIFYTTSLVSTDSNSGSCQTSGTPIKLLFSAPLKRSTYISACKKKKNTIGERVVEKKNDLSLSGFLKKKKLHFFPHSHIRKIFSNALDILKISEEGIAELCSTPYLLSMSHTKNESVERVRTDHVMQN